MIENDRLLTGNKRYLRSIALYGKDDVIDQVRSHTVAEEHGALGRYPMIVTEKYVICVSKFIIALDELEMFDITPVGMYAFPIVTAADNKGNLYRVRVNINAQAQKNILSAVSARAIYTIRDYSPENQIDYKRRHAEEMLQNARELMSGRTVPRYKSSSLQHNRFIYPTILMTVCGFLYLARLIDAEKVSQVVAIILVCCFFFGFAITFIVMGIKRKKRFKEQIGGDTEEVIAEINNRLVYAPDIRSKRGVYVTSKYLILIGECLLRREDVVFFHTYTHKSSENICVGDKDGISYNISVRNYYHDWETEAAIIGSLLPNAVVGNTEENRKYFEQFKA
ncbi:MAG: hypothetical protein K6F49_10900 [Saccharofermentans sp.]|nr:hypothetical protein [Saccharofermentans sp.]